MKAAPTHAEATKTAPTYTTAQAAGLLGVQSATMHNALCKKGCYFGLIPRKGPNGRLLWPAAAVDALLSEKEAR